MELIAGPVRSVGHDLHRPECVVGAPNGDVYVPDFRGGVAVVRADGSQQVWLAETPGFDLRPNGIAVTPDGGFLIANLGDDGGIWKLTTDGGLEPYLTAVGGVQLPPANFVFIDEQDRTWISISTRHLPRQGAWRPNIRDGFIILADKAGARIVADGVHYTNEIRVDPTGRWLYVVETFGRRLMRYAISASGDLGDAELAFTFSDGTFPDGFAFDEEGGIWVTSLITGRLLRCMPDGAIVTVLEDDDLSHVGEVEAAFAGHRLEARHLGPIPTGRFQHLTSLAFAGPDLRTCSMGTLHEASLFRFDSLVAGAPPPHWRYHLP